MPGSNSGRGPPTGKQGHRKAHHQRLIVRLLQSAHAAGKGEIGFPQAAGQPDLCVPQPRFRSEAEKVGVGIQACRQVFEIAQCREPVQVRIDLAIIRAATTPRGGQFLPDRAELRHRALLLNSGSTERGTGAQQLALGRLRRPDAERHIVDRALRKGCRGLVQGQLLLSRSDRDEAPRDFSEDIQLGRLAFHRQHLPPGPGNGTPELTLVPQFDHLRQ